MKNCQHSHHVRKSPLPSYHLVVQAGQPTSGGDRDSINTVVDSLPTAPFVILRPPPRLEGTDHVRVHISLHNEWTPFVMWHLLNLRPVSPELPHASGQRTPSTVRRTTKQRLFPENHHFASLSCLTPINEVLLGRRLVLNALVCS